MVAEWLRFRSRQVLREGRKRLVVVPLVSNLERCRIRRKARAKRHVHRFANLAVCCIPEEEAAASVARRNRAVALVSVLVRILEGVAAAVAPDRLSAAARRAQAEVRQAARVAHRSRVAEQVEEREVRQNRSRAVEPEVVPVRQKMRAAEQVLRNPVVVPVEVVQVRGAEAAR